MRLELLDPVTVKEIYGISRRGQTYAGRVLYVGIIALILYEFWSMNLASTPFVSPSAYAELGRKLFSQFVPFQMIMVSLAAIGAGADRVIREDQAGTLGLLLLTPLTARRILFSKYKAALAQAGSLILCGVPVVAVCVYLGSVGPWALLWCFSLTAAMAALGAASALRASAIYATVPRALVMGFVYMLGFALLPLSLVFVGGFAAIFVAPFLHPAYAAGYLLLNSGTHLEVLNFGWIVATAVSIGCAHFVVSRSARLVEKRVHSPVHRTLAPDAADPAPPGRLGPRHTKAEAPEKPERKTREVWDRDPLLWKELLTRAGNRWTSESKTLFLIYFVIFILLCWLFTRGMSPGTFCGLGALFALLALVNGATLFAPEKEGRKMEMLLSSPLSSADIVRSKLVAGLIAPESIRVALLGLGTAVSFSWWSGPGVLIYAGVFFLFTAFAFFLGSAASLHARTLQGAALASVGILCILVLVLPIVVALLVPGDPTRSLLPLGLRLLSAFDPTWVLQPLDPAAAVSPFVDALGRFLLFASIYGSAIIGLTLAMLARFDRAMGRQ